MNNTLTPSREAADRHASAAEYIIRALDNPNPVYVALVIFGILVAICIVYHLILRQNISGMWIDRATKQLHYIKHHGLSGSKIKIDDHLKGHIDGRAIITKNGIGIICGGHIRWANDASIWDRAA